MARGSHVDSAKNSQADHMFDNELSADMSSRILCCWHWEEEEDPGEEQRLSYEEQACEPAGSNPCVTHVNTMQ